jgi:hypothetical protein
VLERPGEHPDRTAIGDQSADVENAVGRHLDFELHAVRIEAADGELLPRSEQQLAARRLDEPAVFDVRRDQHDIAAVTGADPSLVDDVSGIRTALELQPAGKEIGVEHVQRRADESRRVDDRARSDQDACRIDQEDTAVRKQLALNPGNVGADHAVEHRARGRLLRESRDLARAHRRALPVDHCAGGVSDGEVVRAETLEARAALDNLGSGWIRP